MLSLNRNWENSNSIRLNTITLVVLLRDEWCLHVVFLTHILQIYLIDHSTHNDLGPRAYVLQTQRWYQQAVGWRIETLP
jgi:hypothetical protein